MGWGREGGRSELVSRLITGITGISMRLVELVVCVYLIGHADAASGVLHPMSYT